MTAGTMLLVWMGELITQYGVGQGVSIIIFGGIMARLPFQVFQSFAAGADFGALLVFAVLAIVTVVAIIYVYEGQRRIPVQISKQIRGNRVVGGGTTHIPLKVNSAGMIPLIFASSMLILPWTISSYFVNSDFTIFGITTVGDIATKIYDTFNAASSPVYWTALLHHGRRVHVLLRAGHLPAAEHRRELAASERLHPGYSAGPADPPVPVGGADPHHRRRRALPGHRRRVAVLREDR